MQTYNYHWGNFIIDTPKGFEYYMQYSWPTKIYVSQYTLLQQVQRPQNYEFLLIIYILRRTVLAIIYVYIYYFWKDLQMYATEQFLIIGHSILCYVVDKRIFWKILGFLWPYFINSSGFVITVYIMYLAIIFMNTITGKNNTLIAGVAHPARNTSMVTHTIHMITPSTGVIALLRTVLAIKANWTSYFNKRKYFECFLLPKWCHEPWWI